ncbi:MAG: hypothetical protein ACOZJX_19275 [Pseudomonadota bacterium]
MDIHRQVAGWLAIAMGLLGLVTIATIVLIFGSVAALVGLDGQLATVLASIGGIVAGLLSLFALADIVAGIFYLRGSTFAKFWLIVSNLLFLFAVPVGTAIGAYSLWAILRTPMRIEVRPGAA